MSTFESVRNSERESEQEAVSLHLYFKCINRKISSRKDKGLWNLKISKLIPLRFYIYTCSL